VAKARIICKKVKKKGGGFMFRRVKILASGKWQFAAGACSKAGKKIKAKLKRKKNKKKKRKR
jgi:hypothetical protein